MQKRKGTTGPFFSECDGIEHIFSKLEPGTCIGAPPICEITGFISFHFIFTSFWRVTLQHCWFSRGPPLKEKQYIYTAKIQ